MSNDLYRVRVLAVQPERRTVTLRVFNVYDELEHVPTDPSFFLRVLWDEADRRFGGGGPLGDEVTLEQILDEPWVDQNTARFIERVTRTAMRLRAPAVGKRPEARTDDALTQGDYDVTVTDARWLEHLRPAMTWQTTSYETRATMPPGRETQLLGEPAATSPTTKQPAATKPSRAKSAAAKPGARKPATKSKSAEKAPATAAKRATKKATPSASAKNARPKKPGARRQRSR